MPSPWDGFRVYTPECLFASKVKRIWYRPAAHVSVRYTVPSCVLAGLLISFPFVLHSTDTSTRSNFEPWLCGFVDGEGNFQVWQDRDYTRLAFRIKLHIDDLPLLNTIGSQLGVGQVRSHPTFCEYVVSDLHSLNTVIVPLFLTHGLLTTKHLDLIDFNQVLSIVVASGTSRLTGLEYDKVRAITAGMNRGRTCFDNAPIPSIVNPHWLVGFIEAEGTFGLKHGAPYFQVAQHKRSLAVLVAVRQYFATLHEIPGYGSNTTPITCSLTLNKRTDVYTLSVTGVDTLYAQLLPFLLTQCFFSRKSVDFELWATVLHMHKTGTVYLPEGRALLQSIAACMNDGRYSTAAEPAEVPSINTIQAVLSLPVPVQRQPGQTQVEYSKSVARTLTRVVYVYNKGQLVSGSPFSSYAEAQAAVGLKRTSRAAARYIDTGKVYNGSLFFSSTPKVN